MSAGPHLSPLGRRGLFSWLPLEFEGQSSLSRAIGYEDPKVSYARTGRAPLDETVTFVDG